MCHIIGIEPQFKNIISNDPFIPMTAGQKKPEAQWTVDERKVSNLDQHLKSLIMFVLPDDQMNSVINCLTEKSTWDDLILYHEGPFDVKESKAIDLKLCYNTFKFKKGKSLTQTFTRYKALINELVNDGIKLSKLEINTGFINGLPKKWLSFCQSLRNTNHVKDSKLASLFGKLKYEENLIDSIYEIEKNKSLVSTTPLSTAFFSTSIVQDFQDSLDDEEDTKSSHEYLNDLEEEYQVKALLAKSKRFFKKGQIKDFKAKYHKVKANLALLSSSASTPSSSSGKNKVLIIKMYYWDDEEVSSDENEVTKVKALMALIDEERVSVGKESARNDYLCIDLNYVEEQRNNLLSKYRNLVQELNTCKEQLLVLKQAKLDLLTMQHVNTEILKDNQNLRLELKELTYITETCSNIPKSSKTEDSTLPNQDTDEVPSNESQRNITDPLVVVSNSSATNYDSTDKSSVCSAPLLLLKKFNGITINEPSLAPARGKHSSAFKTNSARAGNAKELITKPVIMLNLCPPLMQIIIILVKVNLLQDPGLQGLHYDHDTHGHNMIIFLRRGINPRNLQHVTNNCETYGSNVYTTSNHNDIEWFRKRETLQAKNVESFKESKNDSSSSLRSKTPTKRKTFTKSPNFREVGLNTFRNAIGAHYLPHSSEYVAPPFIDVVRQWFLMIGYEEEVSAKGTLRKSLLPPRWSKEAIKGGSSKAPTGSKTDHSKKRKEYNSVMDSNPSQPPVSTHVDTRMHKEDQQATGGPTSLGVTSEARANPQLSSGMSAFNLNEPIYSASFIIHSESASGNDASATSTTKADPGNSAPSDFVPQQQGINEGTKNTSYDHLFAGTDPHVLADQTKSVSEGLEIVLTQPITREGANSVASQFEEETSRTIKLEDLAYDEDEDDEVHATENVEIIDTSVPKSSSPMSSQVQELTNQLKELLVKSLKTEFSNILFTHDFSSSLPTELKDLPSKFNGLTEEVKVLKNQVHNLEIELPGELKEIPPKLEGFTKTATSLTSQVDELKTLQTNQSTKEDKEKAKAEVAKRESEVRKEELIDLLGPEVVNKYYNDKLQYDRYYDKMLNRRAVSKITNYDFLTRKDPITLKVYREDSISEIIPNFKASDLHLGEWKEVMKAYPNKTGKGWETIYKQIGTRMDYIHTTEAELGINLDIPLSKQDPLDKLNDLANKKRKHADDIHDDFKASKRLMSSVQYEDHLPSIVLNEPVLEIFFRLHQGPGLDDHTRTFSSLLLPEIFKRNLNPLKQMRFIEELRQ
ncbi:hypothetical protein Tco_1113757 [Tanacetum coccineum]|uniref:Retrovirus-related Pol polyprotein from transposon TNT 1-94 n=1 Tax=Tanacetum coccineum TaxID=301880 RepID=A0ABQ5IWT8_9ASTR